MWAALMLSLAVAPEGEPAAAPVAPLSVAPVSGAASQASRPAPVMVGGYARISPRAPELRPVLATAIAGLTPARNARAKIVRAEQQVVAGTNYRLLIKLRDGSRWRVVVWQRLDGGLEVTETFRES